MSAVTVPLGVSAPSAHTRATMLDALRTKVSRAYNGSLYWLQNLAQRTGVNRGVSFLRKYATKLYNFTASVVRAAGAIPLAVLAVTSHGGQRLIVGAGKLVYKGLTFLGRLLHKALDWTLRRFGKPGNAAADRVISVKNRVGNAIKTKALQLAGKVVPHLNPDRGYMQVAKTIAYGVSAFGIISTFVPGIWTIPAYLVAAIAGIAMNPVVRRNAFVARLLGTFEDTTRHAARKSVAEAMEAMVEEYGPQMSTWSLAAQRDYQVKRAIYNHLDGKPDAFKELSNNQRKRAEKWLSDFEAQVARMEAEAAAAVTGDLEVDAEGHVVIDGALA